MTQIHSTAIVHKDAELNSDVEVGAYSIIGAHVKIDRKTRIMPHVFVDGMTTIGSECRIFPFSSIGTQTQDLKYRGGNTFVEIGNNTTLREYVTVNSGTNAGDVTRIGSRCLIMAYSHVAHQCIVGNDVVISNAGTMAGHVIIEDCAVISGLCGFHQFVRIGCMSFIGGCSKVTQDIPPYMLANGNPITIRGINSVGLERRNVSPQTRKILKDAFKILYHRNLSVHQALEKIKTSLPECPELEHLTTFILQSERGIVR